MSCRSLLGKILTGKSYLAICLFCVGTASVALAQPMAGGGLLDRLRGGGVLLQFLLMEQPSVQQELRATPEQVQAVRQLGDRQRMQLDGLSQLPQSQVVDKLQQVQATSETELKKILSADQHRRLSQISLQQAGPLIGLSNPQVAEAVQLTVEQKSELRRLREDLVAQASASTQPGGFRRGGLLAGIDRLRAAKQQSDSQALALLKPEQQTEWRQLQGEPFRGEINLGPLQAPGNGRPFRPLR